MKKLLLVVVMVAFALGAMPAVAQVVLRDADESYGIVKKLQFEGVKVTESGGTGVIDGASFTPEDTTDPVFTIDATSGTGTTNLTSVSLETAATSSKVAAIKITYTGSASATTTGWLRVYDNPN